MNHLDFIMWMILFPIASSLCSFINARKREITKEKEISSSGADFFSALIMIIVYSSIGYNLY